MEARSGQSHGVGTRAAVFPEPCGRCKICRETGVPIPQAPTTRRVQLVKSGDATFYVEVVETGGPKVVGIGKAMSLKGVRDTVEAVAREMADVWDNVKPDSASVEFGLAITAKGGLLTGLIVDADGSANLKVTLNWKKADAA